MMEWKRLLSFKTHVEREKEPEEFLRYPISELEKDYKAIISSAAFRRLQDKTQVFPLDKSDFVRTRLTHSIEVSTIARQLGIMVTRNTTPYLPEEFKENHEITDEIPLVLSCAGLLHDLGNPPFGHFGEVVIGEWFKKKFADNKFTYKGETIRKIFSNQMRKDLEHFEGNAQALRILSKVKNKRESYETNLTYGVLNTLIKYPTNSLEFYDKDEDAKKHKVGYYYAERDIILDICETTGTKENVNYNRHPLVYLMEAADDIAYSTADLEDALKKELFTLDQFIQFFESEAKKISSTYYKKYTCELIEDLKRRISLKERNKENDIIAFQQWMELVRKWFMYVVSYRFSKSYKEIMNGTYKKDMFWETNHHETVKILKEATRIFVFNNCEILKLELAAKKIIESLLKCQRLIRNWLTSFLKTIRKIIYELKQKII